MSRVLVIAALALAAALGRGGPAWAADKYEIDPEHTSVSFRVSHLGISWVHGRFNKVAGTATLDADDFTKSSITLTIPIRSIDTKVKKRDDHLRSADFFDAEKYPDLVLGHSSRPMNVPPRRRGDKTPLELFRLGLATWPQSIQQVVLHLTR